MRHGRFITTALVATAAMAIGPAWASAAPSPLIDDAQTDFAAAGAQTGTWAVEPGQVRLKRRRVAENFDALPTGWPRPHGSPTVRPCLNVAATRPSTGGVLTSTARTSTTRTPTPTFVAPQTLEFRATFGGEDYQSIGPRRHVRRDPRPPALVTLTGAVRGRGSTQRRMRAPADPAARTSSAHDTAISATTPTVPTSTASSGPPRT